MGTTKSIFICIAISISHLFSYSSDKIFELTKKGKWIEALKLYRKLPSYVKSRKKPKRLKRKQKKRRWHYWKLVKKNSKHKLFLKQLLKVEMHCKKKYFKYPYVLNNGMACSLYKMVHTKSKKRILNVLKQRRKYTKYIRTQCKKQKVPLFLEMIPAIESGYREVVESSAGAQGMWQFMKPTAKDMGLKVNKKTDERKKWKLSTKAALKYFAWLHNEFKSWDKALVAYHWGPGNVASALKEKKRFIEIIPDISKKYLYDFSAYVIIAERGQTIFKLP